MPSVGSGLSPSWFGGYDAHARWSQRAHVGFHWLYALWPNGPQWLYERLFPQGWLVVDEVHGRQVLHPEAGLQVRALR